LTSWRCRCGSNDEVMLSFPDQGCRSPEPPTLITQSQPCPLAVARKTTVVGGADVGPLATFQEL
jgi:hypothetical protein